MTNTWICWLYHYGVGGLLFVASIVLALRAKALRLEHVPDRRLLIAVVAGVMGFMAVHAAWIALASP